jgi:hypothetical protein
MDTLYLRQCRELEELNEGQIKGLIECIIEGLLEGLIV